MWRERESSSKNSLREKGTKSPLTGDVNGEGADGGRVGDGAPGAESDDRLPGPHFPFQALRPWRVRLHVSVGNARDRDAEVGSGGTKVEQDGEPILPPVDVRVRMIELHLFLAFPRI